MTDNGLFTPLDMHAGFTIDRRALVTRDYADKSYLISHSLPKRLLFVGAMIVLAIGWVAWEWVR